MQVDVIVAGAGPVGLLLAAELRLAGVSVIVLERLEGISRAIKAGGINGRSTQLLLRRGLRAALEAEAAKHGAGFTAFAQQQVDDRDRPARRFAGHFAGLFLHPKADLALPPTTVLPQQALEQLLAHWLAELDVPVLRGHSVCRIGAEPEGVSVHAESRNADLIVRGQYLVGCDGGRSTVRKLAGFDFPGTNPLTTGYQAIVTLSDPDSLPLGWNLTESGLCAHGPRIGRLLLVEFGGPPPNRDAELSIEELQGSLGRITGRAVKIAAIEAWTRFTDNTRQAAQYRRGRVLLAGDAAHIHPPFGGQGLNLGLQDAANLGWKLAAEVHGWAPEGLLDSYFSERHPVAAAVLDNTRAQIAIMRPDPHSRAMRKVFASLLETVPDLPDATVEMLQGLEIHYAMGVAHHPLVGRHVPELPGVAEAMRLPRPVLFDRTRCEALRTAARGWSDRLDICDLKSADAPSSMLVRPDGYVAWAIDRLPDQADVADLRASLLRWFGAPADFADAR